VVELNRAVAVAMVHGPEAGLALIDRLAEPLAEYRYLHAARGDLLRRLGRTEDAAEAYRRAAALTTNVPEQAFLAGRIAELA
jgi:RNA polymerase sigma-70 factor (ECF subfamily)